MTTTAHPNVANSVGLAEFLATAGTLTLAQRKLIVDQALILLGDNRSRCGDGMQQDKSAHKYEQKPAI